VKPDYKQNLKMKRLYPMLAIMLATIVFYSFRQSGAEIQSAVVFTARYNQRLDSFKQRLDVLISQLEAAGNKKKPDIGQLGRQYRALRQAFKRWEYLAEYKDPQFVKDHVNGVPLPKPERNSFGLNTVEPHGLQVMDEAAAEMMKPEQRLELLEQATMLQEKLNQYRPDFRIYSSDVFEASRQAILRALSMGLSAFDVPGLGNSLPDTREALLAVWEDLQHLGTLAPHAAFLSMQQKFPLALAYLEQHNDFDRFDRAGFTRDYLLPLYRLCGEWHRASGFELPEERRSQPVAVNYADNAVFSDGFLNAYWYSQLPAALETREMKELGRLLFYDPILSHDNQRACSGCHAPGKGFADGLPKSLSGDRKTVVQRNAAGLLNCVYSERFFHDLRAESLIDQQEHVISDPKEFNTDYFKIIEKLSGSSAYQRMFREAFPEQGDAALDAQNLRLAIAQYVAGLRSFNSGFDRWMRGEIRDIDPLVREGYNLFMGKAACGTCHFAPVFNGTVPPLYQETESEVLGVPENPNAKPLKLDSDPGRGAAKLKEAAPYYLHSFKTPTVRNIVATAPYMHNGAYNTLESVMDFYNRGGGIGHGLQVPYQTLPSDKLGLNKREIEAIIAFMKALEDNPFSASIPESLPAIDAQPALNSRKPGGVF
jgi:cytochrome c peroxidase